MELKTVSWRTSAENSRSKLVMASSEMVKLISSWVMLANHLMCQV